MQLVIQEKDSYRMYVCMGYDAATVQQKMASRSMCVLFAINHSFHPTRSSTPVSVLIMNSINRHVQALLITRQRKHVVMRQGRGSEATEGVFCLQAKKPFHSGSYEHRVPKQKQKIKFSVPGMFICLFVYLCDSTS